MSARKGKPTLCVECGFGVEVDYDGCCETCGRDAVGPAAEATADLLAACEAVIDTDWGVGPHSVGEKVLRLVRAAYAKARGAA